MITESSKRLEMSEAPAGQRTALKKKEGKNTGVSVFVLRLSSGSGFDLIRETAGCGTASDNVSLHHVSYQSRDLVTALRYCSSCSA